jgi:(E)-4-hydroxy-3-methylbut-2-enyl-diphosphate synthase
MAPPATASRPHAARRAFEMLQAQGAAGDAVPVLHHVTFGDVAGGDEASLPLPKDQNELVMRIGADVGGVLIDGLGDGVLLEVADAPLDYLRTTAFGLLQGCRMRNVKTEYVSCPSCGRTLFDLQEVTAQISEKTGHLPGVTIAIMGCIVNGPGEMADADFGYVGGAPGKVGTVAMMWWHIHTDLDS